MQISSVSEYWQNTFHGVKPLAASFRNLFASRWVRFHALPESRRYAKSDDDYVIILNRHNDVLDELAYGQYIILFTVCYSRCEKPKRHNKYLKKFNLTFNKIDKNAKYWLTIPMHEADGDSDNNIFWHIYVSEWKWERGILDQVLRLIADDVLSDVFIASPHESWLYHPYDGGSDVILPSESKRDELKNKYYQWLPQNPSGL